MEAELAGPTLQLHFSPVSSVLVQDLLLPNTADSFQTFLPKYSLENIPWALCLLCKDWVCIHCLPAVVPYTELRGQQQRSALSAGHWMLDSSSRVTMCLPWSSAPPWPSLAVCSHRCVVRWGGPWLWPATDVLLCCLDPAQPPEKAFSLTFKNWLKMALLQLVWCSLHCELRTITYGKGF